MATPLTMIVEFVAAPGKRDELRAELLALIALTRKEDGCILYDLHESIDPPGADAFSTDFSFYEIWRDRAAHAAHDKTPHIAHVISVLPTLATLVRKVNLKKLEPPA